MEVGGHVWSWHHDNEDHVSSEGSIRSHSEVEDAGIIERCWEDLEVRSDFGEEPRDRDVDWPTDGDLLDKLFRAEHVVLASVRPERALDDLAGEGGRPCAAEGAESLEGNADVNIEVAFISRVAEDPVCGRNTGAEVRSDKAVRASDVVDPQPAWPFHREVDVIISHNTCQRRLDGRVVAEHRSDEWLRAVDRASAIAWDDWVVRAPRSRLADVDTVASASVEVLPDAAREAEERWDHWLANVVRVAGSVALRVPEGFSATIIDAVLDRWRILAWSPDTGLLWHPSLSGEVSEADGLDGGGRGNIAKFAGSRAVLAVDAHAAVEVFSAGDEWNVDAVRSAWLNECVDPIAILALGREVASVNRTLAVARAGLAVNTSAARNEVATADCWELGQVAWAWLAIGDDVPIVVVAAGLWNDASG
jgi:hypothetical protein